jgi:hypothetical protein
VEKLFSFDVTLEMLESLRINKFDKVEFVLDFLKKFWMERSGGNDPEYWNRVRVGSVDVYLDDGNQLHLDFVTRFHLDNYPEIIELLKKVKDA